jgi:hypothetical protein
LTTTSVSRPHKHTNARMHACRIAREPAHIQARTTRTKIDRCQTEKRYRYSRSMMPASSAETPNSSRVSSTTAACRVTNASSSSTLYRRSQPISCDAAIELLLLEEPPLLFALGLTAAAAADEDLLLARGGGDSTGSSSHSSPHPSSSDMAGMRHVDVPICLRFERKGFFCARPRNLHPVDFAFSRSHQTVISERQW